MRKWQRWGSVCGAVWSRQLKLSTKVCWEATSCLLAVPNTPCATWIPGVLRRADEAHEASPSLLVVETAHNWNQLAVTVGCSLCSWSEIIQVSQDNQFMLWTSWFFSPHKTSNQYTYPPKLSVLMQLQHSSPLSWSLWQKREEDGFTNNLPMSDILGKASSVKCILGKEAPMFVCFVTRYWELLLWHRVSGKSGSGCGLHSMTNGLGLGQDGWGSSLVIQSISKRPIGLWECGSFLWNETNWQDRLCFLPSATWTGLRLTEVPHHPLRRWKWSWGIPTAWGTRNRFY